MESDKSTKDPSLPLIDTSVFKEYLVQKFKGIIENIPSKKVLLLDPSLELNFGYLFPKKEDIRSLAVELYLANSDTFSCDEKNVIFLTAPTVSMMKRISKIIMTNKMNKDEKTYFLIFTPRRTFLCKEALEREGVFAEVTLMNFNFDLMPLENDLLSMQLENVPRELYLDSDTSSLVSVAEAIQRIQLMYGHIPHIIGKGPAAKSTLDILNNLEGEGKSKQEEQMLEKEGAIGCLVLFDRNVDFVTPMMTQFTYAGFIDETFGIRNNMITLDAKILQPDEVKEHEVKKTTRLLDRDFVYADLKDLHYVAVADHLEKRWNVIQEMRAQVNRQEKDMASTKNTLELIKEMQRESPLVTDHRAITYSLSDMMSTPAHFFSMKVEQGILDNVKSHETLDYIEMMIAKQAKFENIMRILCLQSQIENGLKPTILDSIKKDILHVYGFDHILLLSNLERIGLLKRDSGKATWNTVNNWNTINKQLKMINVEVSLNPPNDAAYTYDGYCPILVRLVEKLFQKGGWNSIKDALEVLEGPTIYDEQAGNYAMNMGRKSAIVLFFIGGITYGEIAAIRYIAKAYSNITSIRKELIIFSSNLIDREIIIATTNTINGNKLINMFR